MLIYVYSTGMVGDDMSDIFELIVNELKNEFKDTMIVDETRLLFMMKKYGLSEHSIKKEKIIELLVEEGYIINSDLCLNSDDSNLTSDILRDYLVGIGNKPLLSNQEEIELSKRYKNGDESAKSEMITRNLRLVVSIARRYHCNSMPLMDIIQEGNLGLMKAVDMYDPDKGYRFSTYATWWIRQSITRSICDKARLIRLPVHVNEKIYQIKKFKKEYYDNYQRYPSDSEICSELNISSETLLQVHLLDGSMASLNSTIGDDDDTELEELIKDENSQNIESEVINLCLSEDIANVLETVLTEKEAEIIKLRFGLGNNINSGSLTLEECGRLYGCTRERIRQIESKALRKLKYSRNAKSLRGYVGENILRRDSANV